MFRLYFDRCKTNSDNDRLHIRGEEYSIKRIHKNLIFGEVLPYACLYNKVFRDDPLHLLLFRPIYRYSATTLDIVNSRLLFMAQQDSLLTPYHLVDPIEDDTPLLSLKQENPEEQILAYERLLCHQVGRMHAVFTQHDTLSYGIYHLHQSNQHEEEKLVGEITWYLPNNILTAYERRNSRFLRYFGFGIVNWLRRKYYNIKTGILRQLYKSIDNELLFNNFLPPAYDYRRDQYFDKNDEVEGQCFLSTTRDSAELLASLSDHELVDCPYRFSDYVYLHWIMIDPEYQGKGIGKMLIDYSLCEIPNVSSIPDKIWGLINWGYKGPQKIYVISSAAGKRLYEKLGFKCIYEFQFSTNDCVQPENSENEQDDKSVDENVETVTYGLELVR
ncbi:hypothetical protein NADFUDRAFT_83362 [Nadsonia fulvescens var. elongata DSM 6958]|uniref:N-acetyltransferase domain-containing protein n=1 Tax=Nadsonia fulvescens var. elongata DSM 6958 TaxID=857566 RepID=A0A1E3PJI4_9ASCO|nr:hypothetical protein NADFUDRAFT_83362 [Nadsonia fulvescens var. elongata DSM 6958]